MVTFCGLQPGGTSLPSADKFRLVAGSATAPLRSALSAGLIFKTSIVIWYVTCSIPLRACIGERSSRCYTGNVDFYPIPERGTILIVDQRQCRKKLRLSRLHFLPTPAESAMWPLTTHSSCSALGTRRKFLRRNTKSCQTRKSGTWRSGGFLRSLRTATPPLCRR